MALAHTTVKPFVCFGNTLQLNAFVKETRLHICTDKGVYSPALSPKIRWRGNPSSYLIGPREVDEALQNGWAQSVHHIYG